MSVKLQKSATVENCVTGSHKGALVRGRCRGGSRTVEKLESFSSGVFLRRQRRCGRVRGVWFAASSGLQFQNSLAKCVSMSLCRGRFDVQALLEPSENDDNMAGCRYLSWSVSRTSSRRNTLPWLPSNNTYSPKTNARPSLMWLLQGLSGSF